MMRVLHVLDHSLPQQSGYAARSHAILMAQRSRGFDITAITGPKQGVCPSTVQQIDGIAYCRAGSESDMQVHGPMGQLRTVIVTRRGIRDRLAQADADILHAHSPCLNGLAAYRMARPLVYEMRSSWEDAAVSNGTTTEGSIRYRASRLLETAVVRRADAVVTICDGLRRELVSRGVPGEKIVVVPNALPDAMFLPPDAGAVDELKTSLGLQGSNVIGFFGSFFEWEGVDLLLQAMPLIVKTVPDTQLIIAGGGLQLGEIQKLIGELELDRHVSLLGRVPGEKIRTYYALADVMVYPRRPGRLTDMVTPLKPLEAMAQGVPVVASDVGGHRELIRDSSTGFLHVPGDVASIAERVCAVLLQDEAVRTVVENAKRWVDAERRWTSVSERYSELYQRIGGSTT